MCGEEPETYRELLNASQGLWIQLCDISPLQVTGQKPHALCGGKRVKVVRPSGQEPPPSSPVCSGGPLMSCTCGGGWQGRQEGS